MGIEEIKKAKEEAKKVLNRPSQKVAALLIALGPTTASEILKNIKIDRLIDAGELKQYLVKEGKSLFPAAKLTERPDVLVNALMEGKIIDLRVILLGDPNVGKKSMVQRFKSLKFYLEPLNFGIKIKNKKWEMFSIAVKETIILTIIQSIMMKFIIILIYLISVTLKIMGTM